MREYFDEVRKLRQEFNDDVIVLMQVGSFYEIYEIEDKGGHAKLVAGLLGYQLTKRNSKLPASDDNPWLCGFPPHNLGKVISRINDEGYTVALYDQRPENAKERYRRGVYCACIRSDAEDQPTEAEKRLFSVRIEAYRCGLQQRVKTIRFLFSIVFIDMDTGKIRMKEYDTDDWVTAFHFVHLRYQPNEVLLRMLGDYDFHPPDASFGKCHVLKDDNSNNHRVDVLFDAFNLCPNEDPMTQLSLGRHPGLLAALVDLVAFVQKYDPCLIQQMTPPEWFDDGALTLEYNRDAFLELNIMDICMRRRSYVDKTKQKTVFDVLNQAASPMGKRRLREILRSPVVHGDTIRQRLDKCCKYQGMAAYEKSLKEVLMAVPDLDWLLFRWKRGKITPRTVAVFTLTTRNLVAFLMSVPELAEIATPMHGILDRMDEIWDIPALAEDRLDAIRNPSDALQTEMRLLQMLEDSLAKIDEEVNFAKDNSFKLIRIDNLYYFQTTKKRWESVRSSPIFHKYSANLMANGCRFFSAEMHTISRQLKNVEDRIKTMVMEEFRCGSDRILNEHNGATIIAHFSRDIAELDYQFFLAQYFRKHKYVRPEVRDGIQSMVRAEGLRHVIIETIDRDRLFVPHAVNLGEDNHLGMIIFGMNSSGKSTYLKSIGIAVWLAQCGLFVPADQFSLVPFHSLMTKIGMFDNLYAGHSTFIAEMNELHYIFRKAIHNYTLVLCDELTAGTEMMSAVGIVTATVRHFVDHHITHIITTHLHILSEIPDIIQDPKVGIHHFVTESDKTTSLLINDLKIRYNRALIPGSGRASYGIEIANDMGLPKDFIRKAFEIRSNITVAWKPKRKPHRSRYNKKLWMTRCIHCGGADRLHTHHITPQATFPSDHSTPSKNGLYNLIVLCEECHENVHHHHP